MNRNASKLAPDMPIITVGDLITELCTWPDHATVKFTCPRSSAVLCFSRVESLSQGIVEIELQPAPEIAPIVPA